MKNYPDDVTEKDIVENFEEPAEDSCPCGCPRDADGNCPECDAGDKAYEDRREREIFGE